MPTDSDRPWTIRRVLDDPMYTPPGQATLDWHTAARERDEAYLAQGAVDDSETVDGPWGGTLPPARGTCCPGVDPARDCPVHGGW